MRQEKKKGARVSPQVVVERADDEKVKALVPVKAPREEASRGRRCQKLPLLRLLHTLLALLILRLLVVLLGKRPIDEGPTGKIADAAKDIGGDLLGEFLVGRRTVGRRCLRCQRKTLGKMSLVC